MKPAPKDQQIAIARFRLQILTNYYELQKELPERTPLTAIEAAEALGIHIATISLWENAWKDGGLDALGAARGIQHKNTKDVRY